jgi:hypothetical protein
VRVSGGRWSGRPGRRASGAGQVATLNTGTLTAYAFAPDRRTLYLAEGASVGADGVAPRGIDTAHGNRIVTYGTKTSPVFTLAGTNSIGAWGGDLLAVVGVGRVQTTVSDKRLATASVGKPPKYLTPTTLAYRHPADRYRMTHAALGLYRVRFPWMSRRLSSSSTSIANMAP